MHLFRSEESVRSWSEFDPDTEKYILPVAAWAAWFGSVDLVRCRLEPDFVEKSEVYGPEALESLGKLIG